MTCQKEVWRILKATIRLMEMLPGRLIISCVENDPDMLDVNAELV